MNKELGNWVDVCVVGGAGHVGLPLGLVLADSGYFVRFLDQNDLPLRYLIDGKLPFVEEGAQELLDRINARAQETCKSCYDFRQSLKYVRNAKVVIVCVGTPVDEYLQPRPDKLLAVIREMVPHLQSGQHVMLRSTLFPGTMRRIRDLLPTSVELSYCPERIVQGQAVKELRELPQIVSAYNEHSATTARELFNKIRTGKYVTLDPNLNKLDILHTITCRPEEAELAKLFLNSWRYIQFAAANQFLAVAEELGVDYLKVDQAMKAGYPRGQALPRPGFAAGPCLLKDTMQIAAVLPQGFPLGHAARQVNESLPELVAKKLRDNLGPPGLVGVLGMAFKADNDDHRDSLSFKLARVLEREGYEVVCSDEHMQRTGFVTKEEVIERCQAVIVAVPHAAYRGLDLQGRTAVDLWGVTQNGDYR